MKKIKNIVLLVMITTSLLSTNSCSQRFAPESLTVSPAIHLNQLGFHPKAQKIAVCVEAKRSKFRLYSALDNSLAYEGTLSDTLYWSESGENARIADFSDYKGTGTFYLSLDNKSRSHAFSISDDVYSNLHAASLKAYYLNRAGIEIEESHAGTYARKMGHPDTEIFVHSSAASSKRPTGTVISSPKGWYDAGDYNKYIVNSGITLFTLLSSYEQNQEYYSKLNTNIPESGNGAPDILNEIKWNLDWAITMQDPFDGGVYHKLTTENFTGKAMPHTLSFKRYVVQKSTGATLDFAAFCAQASRIFSRYEKVFPGYASTLHNAAVSAWNWAKANPNEKYLQPSDIKTGQYEDFTSFYDEFAWASAELYLLTSQEHYYDAFKEYASLPSIPWWQDVMTLGYVSLLNSGKDKIPKDDYAKYRESILQLAEQINAKISRNAYKVAMEGSDFTWGSNAVAANQGLILMTAYRLTRKRLYLDAAQAQLDYLLGRNATGYSFVTGYGSKTPKNIHQRISVSDGVDEPHPGLLVGGPHSGRQDNCAYESHEPAKSYLDDWCSYSTNEVAINWNAPLVYLLAGIISSY